MADEPERADDHRDAKGRFQPGNAGRPKGTFNRATMLAQALIGKEAGKLARQAIKQALAGDSVALKVCLERLVPAARAGSIRINLPPVKTLEDIPVAMAAVIEAVSIGMISLDDGDRLVGLLDRQRIALEGPDLESRLKELERAYREISNAQVVGSRSVAQPNGRGL
jgi:hypothetical protein